MGRSVSYPSDALVVTFASSFWSCEEAEDHTDCLYCDGSGICQPEDFDDLIYDFRQHLKELFPSVVEADRWIDREDHVLAENGLASFGMSEYCGLVAYWIVPKEYNGPKGEFYYSSDRDISAISTRWVRQNTDKFVAAFGELSKVGSMSNGEGVYRRIDR